MSVLAGELNYDRLYASTEVRDVESTCPKNYVLSVFRVQPEKCYASGRSTKWNIV